MTIRSTALVTGASRGIGRAIAHRLAGAGYDLMLSARNEEALATQTDELRRLGGNVDFMRADLTKEDELDALAQAQPDALDVLILSGGVGSAGDLDRYPLSRLDRQYAVNFRSSFQLVQRLLPALRRAATNNAETGAKIVAIASITGVASEPGLAAYGATKAALISLCESIIAAEGESGVNATAISPGYVNTDMAEWMRDRIAPQHMIQASDVAELALSVCRLSRFAAVPNIVMTRPGGQLWRA